MKAENVVVEALLLFKLVGGIMVNGQMRTLNHVTDYSHANKRQTIWKLSEITASHLTLVQTKFDLHYLNTPQVREKCVHAM